MSKNVGSATMGVRKCGIWDYGCLKIWEVRLWVSNNVGSGTLGSKICGKWDFQDPVSPPPPLHIDLHT